jgi:hypothetical protein
LSSLTAVCNAKYTPKKSGFPLLNYNASQELLLCSNKRRSISTKSSFHSSHSNRRLSALSRHRSMSVPIAGVAALATAAAFTGACFVISVAEQPARMRLSPRAALDQWVPSYARALPMQAGLAVTGAVLGGLAFHASGVVLFACGALACVSNWPYTFIFMMPTNNRLKAMQRDKKAEDEPRIVDMMNKWGRLHAIRGGLGVLATSLFAMAILTGKSN